MTDIANAGDARSEQDVRIAVLIGGDDLPAMKFGRHERREMLQGNTNFGKVIAEAGFHVTNFDITPSYYRQKLRWKFDVYDAVFNAISDPDTNPKCLDIAVKMEKDHGRPFLNSPRYLQLLHRDKAAEIAATIPGICVPKTIRLTQLAPQRIERAVALADLKFPAILRPAGSHQGEGAQIVTSLGEVVDSVASGRNYYLTEFVDYRSPDGYYRKYRFAVIGDEVFPRPMVIGPNWNLHRADRTTDLPGVDFLAEQTEFYRAFTADEFGAIAEMMRALARKARLEFMGVDCCVTSPSTIVLFEANPTMSIVRGKSPPMTPDFEKRRAAICAAVRKLIWERVRTAPRKAEPPAARPRGADTPLEV